MEDHEREQVVDAIFAAVVIASSNLKDHNISSFETCAALANAILSGLEQYGFKVVRNADRD